MPRRAALAALISAVCAVVIGVLVVGASLRGDRDSVDELPSVAEVAAAQAHGHGQRPDDLTEEERAALLAPPTAATDATPEQQLTQQLTAVASSDGVGVALDLLTLAAASDPDAAQVCPAVFAAVMAVDPSAAPGLPGVDVVCAVT